MKKKRAHKEIKNVVPNFWLWLLEQWEYRDAFYYYFGLPGFGPTRSILIFVTQVGLSTIALFLGAVMAKKRDYDWWLKMLLSNLFYLILSVMTVKMLQCTNKRYTLSQKKKSCLKGRRVIGYSTCALAWVCSFTVWISLCKYSGYMNDDDTMDGKQFFQLIKDLILMMVLSFPVMFVWALVTYVLFANPCLQAGSKRTVTLRQYRDMVHHNRFVQLAKERGISAINKFEEAESFVEDPAIDADVVLGKHFDNGNNGVVSIGVRLP